MHHMRRMFRTDVMGMACGPAQADPTVPDGFVPERIQFG